MQLSIANNKPVAAAAQKQQVLRGAALTAQPRRPVAPARALNDKLPIDVSSVVGPTLGKWLDTPLSLLAFPARVGTGALVSVPERLQTLQSDVQRIVELAQDPRPVEEKQEVLRKELEDTVVTFLERGTVIEQDVLSNLKAVLPPDAANALTELIPKPPTETEPVTPYEPADIHTYSTYESSAPTTTYGASDVISSQIASEITEIRTAVSELKSSLEAIRANADAASASMLKLRLREARDQLQRRLAEVSPSTAPDPSLAAATREASILLDEVNTMFFPAPGASSSV